jgi:hypothetical protein
MRVRACVCRCVYYPKRSEMNWMMVKKETERGKGLKVVTTCRQNMGKDRAGLERWDGKHALLFVCLKSFRFLGVSLSIPLPLSQFFTHTHTHARTRSQFLSLTHLQSNTLFLCPPLSLSLPVSPYLSFTYSFSLGRSNSYLIKCVSA